MILPKNKDISTMSRQDVAALVLSPTNEKLPPQQRLENCLAMSDLITKMVTFIICHTIVDFEDDLMHDERLSVANAFLQRVTSTHLCNHKLTKEGISFKYKGEEFHLHEEFKTMTLTRSVYEHLVMFYFLYEHPKSTEERSVAWNYWKINSKKNFLDFFPTDAEQTSEEQDHVQADIEALRKEIFDTHIGQQCHKVLDEWTKIGKAAKPGSLEFYKEEEQLKVRRITYGQAWKYLFDKEEMMQFYRHLSMHCHPIYDGLLQYQSQAQTDEGYDGIPLYLSSCFLAYLCRLFLKQISQGNKLLKQQFSRQELYVFNALAQLPNDE